MTVITEPFPLVPGQTADANQLEADLSLMRSIVNGQLEMGVNVQAGAASAIDGDASSPGSSNTGARSDHVHAVRGVESLSADPSARVGRIYFNTVSNTLRMCILVSPPTWVTIGNMAGSDLPAHASRHADAGADPLPANSVAETMLKARTIYRGVISGGDITLSANSWTDIVTGLAVTITGTQVAWLCINAAVHNGSGANSPLVTFRVIDGGGAVLFQTGAQQMSTEGANNDSTPFNSVYPVLLSASPTLKLQANSSFASLIVRKTQAQNGSSFEATSLSVVVG